MAAQNTSGTSFFLLRISGSQQTTPSSVKAKSRAESFPAVAPRFASRVRPAGATRCATCSRATNGAPRKHRLGLVQEVTAPGKELDRALDLANKIAAAAPLGVRATLASSRQALAVDEATALAALPAEFGRLLQSQD